MDIIQTVKNYVLSVNKEYADTAPDHYDFWEQHIQFVVKESLILAETYNADKEIVELGSLLHDIALMTKPEQEATIISTESLLQNSCYPKLIIRMTKKNVY